MEVPFSEDASKDSRGHRTGVSSILETASVASNLKITDCRPVQTHTDRSPSRFIAHSISLCIAGIKHLTGLQHRTSGQLCEPSPEIWNSPVPSQHPLECSFRGRRKVLSHLLINQFLGLLRLHRIGRGDVFAAPQSLRRSIDGDRPSVGQAFFVETLPEVPDRQIPSHLEICDRPLEVLFTLLSKPGQTLEFKGVQLVRDGKLMCFILGPRQLLLPFPAEGSCDVSLYHKFQPWNTGIGCRP